MSAKTVTAGQVDLVAAAAAAAAAETVVSAGNENGIAIAASAVVTAVTAAPVVVVVVIVVTAGVEEIVAMMAGLRDATEICLMTDEATDGAIGTEVEAAETEMRICSRKTDAAAARPLRRRNESLLPISPTSCRSSSASAA